MAPDRLRFDFSHHEGVRPEELAAVAELANGDVLSDAPVEVIETSKAEAEAMGALAFFGDKYGERVRVVRAGAHSTELCGGTHVDALGMIGPITVVSEGSIGSNTRRIEAVTGAGSLALLGERQRTLDEAARLLRVEPDGVVDALERLHGTPAPGRQGAGQRLQAARARGDRPRLADGGRGRAWWSSASTGSAPTSCATWPRPSAAAVPATVVLAGSPDGAKVARRGGLGRHATPAVTVKELAALVGGGGGGSRRGGGGRAARTRPGSTTCWPRPGAASAAAEPVRVVGIDLGARRIGVAVSDSRGHPGVAAHHDRAHRAIRTRDRAALVALVTEEGAGTGGGRPARQPRRPRAARRRGPLTPRPPPWPRPLPPSGWRWRPSTSASPP